jgi:hypothetical protein
MVSPRPLVHRINRAIDTARSIARLKALAPSPHSLFSVSIIIDAAALLWFLTRQVRTRPLKESYTVPIVLGAIGLFELVARSGRLPRG